jgi:hypothetical protein
MAPGVAKKKQINVPWSEPDDNRLDELSDAYEIAKLALAQTLLRYGMRHAKRAMREQNARAESKFKDSDDP